MSIHQATQVPALKESIFALLEQLPAIESIPLTNGDADYYGASWRIANAMGLEKPLSTNTFWSHGWHHARKIENPILLAFGPPRPGRNYLVATSKHANYLREYGYSAHAVGLPFLYTEAPIISRVPQSLLIMPSHTTTHNKQDFSNSSFPEEILSFEDRFEHKVACISGQCVQHNIWMRQFEERDIPWITGAWIFDKNSLVRMRTLFSAFEYMGTNVIGSHVVYAAFCGCKVFFTEILERPNNPEVTIRHEPFYQRYPEMLEIVLKNRDEGRLKRDFPWLFKGIDGATVQTAWAACELGLDVKRDAAEMADLLGWKPQDIQRQRMDFSGLKAALLRSQKKRSNAITAFTTDADERNTRLTQLLNKARLSLNYGDFYSALQQTADIKAARLPIKGVDEVRGLAFMGLGATLAAIESFKEELRAFPDHPELRKHLNQLAAKQSAPPPQADECERLIWEVRDYTMVGPERLRSLYQLTKRICLEDKHGCFVECGVAAGGSSALIAWVIGRYSKRQRQLFCFDTFEGMPDPTPEDVTADNVTANQSGWGAGTCRASVDSLQAICQTLGVLPIVRPVQGLFCETLPKWRETLGTIAFLHMDGDWYDSTRDILDNLYDRVQFNGLIQIDDYGHWAGCRKAVHQFAAKRSLKFYLNQIDYSGVWMQKQQSNIKE